MYGFEVLVKSKQASIVSAAKSTSEFLHFLGEAKAMLRVNFHFGKLFSFISLLCVQKGNEI